MGSLAQALTADGAAADPNAGVTATTIRIGVPYIDFSALRALGVSLDQGSVPDAYNALVANLNAHGGIDGRKVVLTMAGVNPSSPAQAQSVCTQLTEDQQIFVAMGPYEPNCYLQQHGTPTMNAALPGTIPPGSAANFTLTPPASAYDPLQLSVFKRLGLFRGKKIGVFAASADQAELGVVESSLRKLHLPVTQVAVDSAPSSDQQATNAQVAAIAERFQTDGVNEVVAVGTGSSIWPASNYDNQGTYNPPWIATAFTALSGSIGGTSKNAPTFLKTVTTSTPTLPQVRVWNDPSVQACVRIIEKAYPSDTITPPSLSSNSSDHTYVAPLAACQSLAMFTKIAMAAGKKLTVASFTKAGYGLRNVAFPGSGGPVSFGPGQAYAIGPVYLAKYSVAAGQLVTSAKSVAP
jgi:hypothetical protein